MKVQEKLDRAMDLQNGVDPVSTKMDREEAKRLFDMQEALLSRQERKASQLDVDNAVFDMVTGLDGAGRFVPYKKHLAGMLVEQDNGGGSTRIEWMGPTNADRAGILGYIPPAVEGEPGVFEWIENPDGVDRRFLKAEGDTLGFVAINELPAGGAQGDVLAFGALSPYWLAAPLGLALLTHDGDDPAWLAVPSSGAGMMVWDYATGAQMSTGVGYPYAYATGVTFSTRIPTNKLSSTGSEGYFILCVDQYGSVSEIAMENLTKHAFSGTGSGRYMLSFDVNGESPALYEIGAGYV
jgi:hypothetical protein